MIFFSWLFSVCGKKCAKAYANDYVPTDMNLPNATVFSNTNNTNLPNATVFFEHE